VATTGRGRSARGEAAHVSDRPEPVLVGGRSVGLDTGSSIGKMTLTNKRLFE
jgi:hypothetical protein